MIAHLETIEVDGKHYLTELTYVVGSAGKRVVAYYFINHPGATATDALFKELDPTYREPVRYGVRPPIAVFLKEHNRYSPDNTVYVLEEKIQFFEGFVQMALPHLHPEYTPDFEPLENHFSPETIETILEEFREARQKALNP